MLPVHRELLAQALVDLVDNSLKYGAGTITLALTVADGRARIAVADEGEGIPPEHRATALRRFGRVDKRRAARRVPGLGLSLVAAVAQLRRGPSCWRMTASFRDDGCRSASESGNDEVTSFPFSL
ncbi:ATP-binding protein [Sphingomonas sp. MMS24-JH45]